jgi:3-mercaptopyruvate sulfurtransferase SseA
VSRLISAEELASRLGEPGLAVLEVAFHPPRGPFLEAHVPGSRWAHWKALCWHDSERRFPSPETLAERLGALGVGSDDELVLVGDPIQFGAYAYWVLHMLGRPARILDGGRERWLAGGFPVESGEPTALRAEHAVPAVAPDFSSTIGASRRPPRRSTTARSATGTSPVRATSRTSGCSPATAPCCRPTGCARSSPR